MSVFAGRAVFPPSFTDSLGNSRAGVSISVYRRVTYTDGVTTAFSTLLTSAAADFTSDDEGVVIAAAGFPSGTTIVEYVSESSVRLSAAALTTGTGRSFYMVGRNRTADLATVYSDRLKASTTSNPFVADSVGNMGKFFDAGEYDAVTVFGITSFSVPADVGDVTAGDATAVKLTGDQTVTAGRKNFQGGIVVKGPRQINLQSYGVSPGGIINTALPLLLADAASSGAEAVIDPTAAGEYLWTLTTPITLPKTFGFRLGGVESYGSLIKATQLPVGTAMVKWDDTVAGHVESQSLRDLSFTRTTDGPVIQFLQYIPPGGWPSDDRRLGDRWKSRIENVRVQNITAGTYPVIEIEYILHGKIVNPWLYGSAGAGGIGVLIRNGSHAKIHDLYTPLKSNAPRTALKMTDGGAHVVLNPRTEGGGQGGVSIHLVTVSSSVFVNPSTEGTGEDSVFLLDGCFGNVFHSPVIGYPDESGSGKPRGVKLVNSSGNIFTGGQAGDWSDFKDDAKAATTANIALSGEQTIDGVAVTAGQRVLVKNQTAGAENGIYVAAVGAWTRATDADTSAEMTVGTTLLVENGTTQAHTRWKLATTDAVLGTTALVWSLVGTVAPYTQGDGTGGKLIEFDAGSHENVVDGLVIISGLNPIAQVLDNGKSNRVRLLVQGTNDPTYQRQSLGFPKRGVRKPQKWYTSAGTPTTGLMTLNRAYYLPFDVDELTSLDRLGVGITTGATAASGATIRLGLYADDGTNWPGPLIAGSEGTVDATVVAAANIVISPTLRLSPGRYWRAAVAQGAPATAPTVRVTGAISDPTVGLFTQGDAWAVALIQEGVTGALPAVAAPTASLGTACPLIPFRV